MPANPSKSGLRGEYHMRRFCRQIARLIILTMLTVSFAACALTGDAIQGKVLEAGTEKPIPDAIVVARWMGRVSSYVDSQTVCYHVLSTTTDAEGHYSLPAWRKEITEEWQKNLTPVQVGVSVYKAGYQQSEMDAGEETQRYLKRFSGTREKRLDFLESIKQSTVLCSDPSSNAQSLILLYRAIYVEAKPLAKTELEKNIVDGFASWIAILEGGKTE